MKIEDIRKTVKVELPSYEGGWVEIYDDLLVKDLKDIEQYKISNPEVGIFQQGLMMATKVIKAWSFEDEVTVTNLDRLLNKDLQVIMNRVTEMQKENAKKKE